MACGCNKTVSSPANAQLMGAANGINYKVKTHIKFGGYASGDTIYLTGADVPALEGVGYVTILEQT